MTESQEKSQNSPNQPDSPSPYVIDKPIVCMSGVEDKVQFSVSQVSLNEIAKSPQLERDRFDLTPREERLNRDNKIAGCLAIILWVLLCAVILVHIGLTAYLSWYFVTVKEQPTKEILELANSVVNDNAKTIYTFLGTLVTAVTSYYFNTLARSNSDKDK